MTAQQIPVWLSQPEPAKIQCTFVGRGLGKEEYSVQFIGNGESYTAFVPSVYIDPATKQMDILIVAEVGDEFLIDLPVDTLTSGTRIRIPKLAEELIFQS